MSGIMILPAFAMLWVLLVSAQDQDFCYKNVVGTCNAGKRGAPITNCNATYGGINKILPDLLAYANTHISRSFEYLLMSTHFANYQKNRPGFEKLFRSFSDEKWHEAIKIIKHIAKRGGSMDFSWRKSDVVNVNMTELYEVKSVADALDLEKALAIEAHSIHYGAARHRPEWHDPEISSFLEKEFVHKHASNIRRLSGYVTDLINLSRTSDDTLALYLFDEYLQKSL